MSSSRSSTPALPAVTAIFSIFIAACRLPEVIGSGVSPRMRSLDRKVTPQVSELSLLRRLPAGLGKSHRFHIISNHENDTLMD